MIMRKRVWSLLVSRQKATLLNSSRLLLFPTRRSTRIDLGKCLPAANPLHGNCCTFYYSTTTSDAKVVEENNNKKRWKLNDNLSNVLPTTEKWNDLFRQLEKKGIKTFEDLKPHLLERKDNNKEEDIQNIFDQLQIDSQQLLKHLEKNSFLNTFKQKNHHNVIAPEEFKEQLNHINKHFTKGAVSYHLSTTFNNPDSSIGLILGPSGSGKTFFAVKNIHSAWPQQQQNNNDEVAHQCTIYTALSDDSSSDSLNATQWGQIISQQVEMAMKQNKISMDDDDDKNKTLFIVCDQAHVALQSISNGGEPITWNDLQTIHTELQQQLFAPNVKLVLVGTGLEYWTRTIDHDNIVRFRMRQWETKHFEAMMKKEMSKMKKKKKNDDDDDTKRDLMDLIKGDDLYLQLATNARAAHSLVQSARSIIQSKTPVHNNDILHQVAHEYIHHLGFPTKSIAELKQITKTLMKLLDRSQETAQWPFLNDTDDWFNDDDDEKRHADILALLEINVEFRNGEWHRIDDSRHSNVFTSPAITTMLLYTAFFSHIKRLDWGSLPARAARHELQRLFAQQQQQQSKDYDELGVKLFGNSFQVVERPHGNKKAYMIPIPIVREGQVLLKNLDRIINDQGSRYGDIIVKNRLIRCKHTDTVDEPVLLKLDKELKKMGLRERSTVEQKMVISALYKVFQSNNDDNDEWAKKITTNDDDDDGLCECYDAKFQSGNLYMGPKIGFIQNICHEYPELLVIFYTNATSFEIPMGFKETVIVDATHVDEQGRIKEDTRLKRQLAGRVRGKGKNSLKCHVSIDALRFRFLTAM